MKASAFAKWMGFMALECTTEAQYGSLNKYLTQQFSMTTDQYPKTLTAATDVLANHKPDVKLSYQNKKFKSTEVKNEQIVETSFVQEQKGHHFQCNCCGKKGHTCAICWKRDTTKQEDWWINKQKNKQSGQYPNKKGKSFHQKKSKNDSDNSDDDDDSDDSGKSVA